MQTEEWRDAMTKEFNALIDNKTGFLYLLKNHRMLLETNGYTESRESRMKVLRDFKARLVAKGFHQCLGVDYETFKVSLSNQELFEQFSQ